MVNGYVQPWKNPFLEKKGDDVLQHSLYALVRRPGKVLREEKSSESWTELDECHAYCVLNIFGGKVKEVKPGQLSEVSQDPAFINLLQERTNVAYYP